MPELHFTVRWPDGRERSYYSPSTAVLGQLTAGVSYALPDFLERARRAMHAASERVRAKYGFTCSSALDTLRQIEAAAAELEAAEPGRVLVVSVEIPAR